jgi:methyl-accepting chemotaxis protein
LLAASQAEIKDMVTTFTDNVAKNSNSPIPNHLKLQFNKVQTSVKTYGDYAINLTQMANTNSTAAIAALPKFDAVFGQLEEDQGKASDLLMDWSKDLENQHKTISQYFQVILTCLGLLAIGVPTFAIVRIFNPLTATIACMEQLSKGNTAITVPYRHRQDELGVMAQTIQVFKANAEENAQLSEKQAELKTELQASLNHAENELQTALAKMAADQQEADQKSEEARQTTRENLATRFEQKVTGIIQNVVQSATALQGSSEILDKTINANTSEALKVANSAEKTSHNVESIASALEEMSATVNEISKQMAYSSSAVQQAVTQMEKADETAGWLDDATSQIGKIIETISSIAGQINLLALNATIESASAGEAGKGFAVVANEVKLLAAQTKDATNEISTKVGNIQGASKQVIEALSNIKASVDKINDISLTVTSAVEQQSITTQEIAKSMVMASHSVNTINGNMSAISQSSEQASQAATKALGASSILSLESEKLDQEVKHFLTEVRQG